MTESNQAFIIAAYAVTWLVFAGYVVRVARAQRRARAALATAASVAGSAS